MTVSDEITISQEPAKALRYNEGKPQWSLIDFDSLIPLVQGMEYGAIKYARDNWKKGLPENKIMESLLRHAFAILRGEIIDEESGVPHIGLLMCNAMFISYFQRQKGLIGPSKE